VTAAIPASPPCRNRGVTAHSAARLRPSGRAGSTRQPLARPSIAPTLAATLLCTAFLATVPAMAQDIDFSGTPVPESAKPWWYFDSNVRVSLGLGAAFAPSYEGSSQLKAEPYPLVDITGLFDGRVSISSTHGVALNVIKLLHLKAGVNVFYSAGRTQDNDDRLLGVPDIGPEATVGGFITYEFRPFAAGMEVQQRLGPGGGITVSLGGDYSFRPIRRLNISVGPRIVFADKNYEQTFFGVSQQTASDADALGNPLRPYNTAAGLKNVELVASARYALSEHWSLAGQLGFSELLGSAANSPLTQHKFQPTFTIGAIYLF
jgi:outer membrane protein